ncbi:MAG: DUF960 domain-containing protein [Oscillospiraceae bacterium]|nr:DUF960 domain-containing protein [Oscillospiraceae bacterium]
MFEPYKKRYLTRGVADSISPEIQLFLWSAVDNMPEPKDYLQIFELKAENGVQYILHKSEEPEYERLYILAEAKQAVTTKIYCIDSEEYCTMLLAEEY